MGWRFLDGFLDGFWMIYECYGGFPGRFVDLWMIFGGFFGGFVGGSMGFQDGLLDFWRILRRYFWMFIDSY